MFLIGKRPPSGELRRGVVGAAGGAPGAEERAAARGARCPAEVGGGLQRASGGGAGRVLGGLGGGGAVGGPVGGWGGLLRWVGLGWKGKGGEVLGGDGEGGDGRVLNSAISLRATEGSRMGAGRGSLTSTSLGQEKTRKGEPTGWSSCFGVLLRGNTEGRLDTAMQTKWILTCGLDKKLF